MIIFSYFASVAFGVFIGFMIFHDSPAKYTYKIKIGNKEHTMSFYQIVTNTYDPRDGLGVRKETYVELAEEY